jgi:hypothetical protein
MQQHVEICTEFVTAIYRRSLAMLGSMVTVDKTMVCYHVPQMKKKTPK